MKWTRERPTEPGLYWIHLPGGPRDEMWLLRVVRPLIGDGLLYQSVYQDLRERRSDELNPALVWCRVPDAPPFEEPNS